jgi:hypothetical protein
MPDQPRDTLGKQLAGWFVKVDCRDDVTAERFPRRPADLAGCDQQEGQQATK